MQITANRDVRISSAMCVLTAPEVFDQHEEDGLVILLVLDAPEELRERVTEAARLCPGQALNVL